MIITVRLLISFGYSLVYSFHYRQKLQSCYQISPFLTQPAREITRRLTRPTEMFNMDTLKEALEELTHDQGYSSETISHGQTSEEDNFSLEEDPTMRPILLQGHVGKYCLC